MAADGENLAVYALVNGLQLIRCPFDGSDVPVDDDDGATNVVPDTVRSAVAAPAAKDLTIMEDVGRFELTLLFYCSEPLLTAPQQPCVARHFGELVVDGTAVYLGALPMNGAPPVSIARYLDKYPEKFELRVVSTTRRLPHPEEESLLLEMHAILCDARLTPPGGSVSLNLMTSRLQELAVYPRVTANTNLRSIIALHPDRFALVAGPTGDMHVTKAADAHTYEGPNAARALVRDQQEAVIVRHLKEILASGEKEYVDVLQRLSLVPEFTGQLTPTAAVLRRFLQTHSDVFWLRKDPMHTTRVGLVANHSAES